MSRDPDGDGPEPAQLIAGGAFTTADTRTVSYIARWDPESASWQSLGAGLDDWVLSLTTWDPDGPGPDGPQLVAAGYFGRADGKTAKRIARWDGSAWQAIGAGFDFTKRAVAVWDRDGAGPLPGQLVVGGEDAGGIHTFVYGWDGAAWQAITPGLNGNTRALTTWDPDGPGPAPADLMVGGDFTTAGGLTVNRIARWDGSTLHALGGGLTGASNAVVFALTNWDPDGDGPVNPWLVAGGAGIQHAGGAPAFGIASWDGAAWRSRPTAANQVYALTTWDVDGDGSGRDLVAGGSFVYAGVRVGHVARWDEPAGGWQPFGDGFNDSISAQVAWDPDGDGPQPVGIVVGGDFTARGEQRLSRIARWDPTDDSWHPLSTGMDGEIFCFTLWDADGVGPSRPQIVAGGNFEQAGGVAAESIARWDDEASVWRPFSLGLAPGGVGALATWDPDGPGPLPEALIAAGTFTSAGGPPLNRIARWDPVAGWQPLGTGMDFRVNAVLSWDPDGPGPETPLLIAGGEFTRAGGAAISYIAQWNGFTWQPMGALGSFVAALTLWDPDGPGPLLESPVAGGYFSARKRVARWDGAAWLPLGEGVDATVHTLTSWDPDGAGPRRAELIAGGNFLMAGGVQANRIARWDGAAWRALGAGAGSQVSALTAWSPGPSQPVQLVVGGAFVTIDAEPSAYWARWSDCACAADLNGDGIVDFADYLEFLNFFDAGDLRVDFNQDGIVDFGDYLEFLNHFDAGC